MEGIVLAAGLGTRLRPLTEELSKPAIPFMGRPLVELPLRAMGGVGIEQVAMNAFHLPQTLEAAVERAGAGPRVRIFREEMLLGTGGGVRRLGEQLSGEGPVVVMNSDIVFRPDLVTAVKTHHARGAFATMVVRSDPEAAQHGAIEHDDEGVIRRIIGSGIAGEWRKRMFTGVHVLSRAALRDLPEQGCIIRQGYLRWLERGEVIVACVDESAWFDVGTLVRYLDAHLRILRGEVEGWQVDEKHGDVPSSARLHEVVLGADVRLHPQAALERVVVWPGATVSGAHRDSIITPHRVVQVST